MSWQATAWVAYTVPASATTAGAFRVLLALADHAHKDGTAAWHKTTELAEMLECTPRSVKRHLQSLLEAGLIVEGDQNLVLHIRADRRPKVYDLQIHLTRDEIRRGDNPVTPSEPVDNGPGSDSRGDTAVTPSPVDNSDGVTPAVRHGVTAAVRAKTQGMNTQENTTLRAGALAVVDIHKHHDNALRALSTAVSGLAPQSELEGLLELAYEVGRGDPWIGYTMIRTVLDEGLPPRVHSLTALLRYRLAS